MKAAAIKPILQEKLKEMKRYLSKFENDQKDMRKEKQLRHAHDLLEGLSHQIGYMNGAIEQTQQFLELLEISENEFLERRKASKESSDRLKQQIKSMLKK